ncbi:MAG: flagellar motor switch protein FliN [Homoserinimonas sp.]|nr:flagellar motor switch protein FliN [Homoserinimonas sp.]
MRTTVNDVNVEAAEALTALLPSAKPLTAEPLQGELPAGLGAAVVANFVGETSADLAVALLDSDAMTVAGGTDSAIVSLIDVLRPALESAAATLGSGVLGDARQEDASALFADDDTVVFVLMNGRATAGWFAMRVRQNGVVTGPAASVSQESMAGKLGRINNVEMALTVEIGRTRMSVRDVLALEPGAVIELDRSAGAPADVLLNGRLIAHGEIVVIDQDYAVRITKILDVTEGLA